MEQVRAGAEVVIEDDVYPPVVSRFADQPRGRTLSESLKLVRAHAKERNHDVIMDADFADDVAERIRARKPRDTSAWN